MLLKFKNIFLLLLFLAMGYMLWLDKKQMEVLKETNESIIDSLRSIVIKEESVIDSFSSKRATINEQRDSSFSVIDTIGISSLNEILKNNIDEYIRKDTVRRPLIRKPDN